MSNYGCQCSHCVQRRPELGAPYGRFDPRYSPNRVSDYLTGTRNMTATEVREAETMSIKNLIAVKQALQARDPYEALAAHYRDRLIQDAYERIDPFVWSYKPNDFFTTTTPKESIMTATVTPTIHVKPVPPKPLAVQLLASRRAQEQLGLTTYKKYRDEAQASAAAYKVHVKRYAKNVRDLTAALKKIDK